MATMIGKERLASEFFKALRVAKDSDSKIALPLCYNP